MTQLVRISAFGERPLTEVDYYDGSDCDCPFCHWRGVVEDCQIKAHEESAS